MTYDIQIQDFSLCSGGVCPGLWAFGPIHDFTFENNWFGQAVNAVGQAGDIADVVGGTTCGTTFSCMRNTTSNGAALLQFCAANCYPAYAPSPYNTQYWQDCLLRYNSFQGTSSGWYWDSTNANTTFSNCRVIGNTGAGHAFSGSNCSTGPAGLTYDFNAFTANLCGDADSVLLGSLPFVDGASIVSGDQNLHLSGAAGSTSADNFVSPTSSDYALSTDIDEDARSASRDAGSDER